MIVALILAQIATSTTDCTAIVATVHCTSESHPSGPVNYLDALGPPPQAPSIDFQAIRRRDLQKKIGELIANNQCGEARDTALRAGAFDLVDQVTHYCHQ